MIIVLSGLWMIGGTFILANKLDSDARAAAASYYTECEFLGQGEGYNCSAGEQKVYHARTEQLAGGLWGHAAGMAAIYLTLGLITLGVLYGSGRWIMAGRKRP